MMVTVSVATVVDVVRVNVLSVTWEDTCKWGEVSACLNVQGAQNEYENVS